MKITGGTISLASVLLIAFGIELATHSVADDASLLKLGGLPDDGELNGQFWRFATYSFLHFNWTHLLVNLACCCGSGGLSKGAPASRKLERSISQA
jgi:membrane associated rhomboid family serine protease